MKIKNFIPLLLMLVGFAASEVVTRSGADLGIRWHHINSLVMNGLLPAILFHMGLRTSRASLSRNLAPAASLSFIGLLLFLSIGSALAMYSIGHADGFPLAAALVAGLLLCISDLSSVSESRRELSLQTQPRIQLELESLIVSSIGIGLFTWITSEGLSALAAVAIIQLVISLAGGVMLGLIAVFIAQQLQLNTKNMLPNMYVLLIGLAVTSVGLALNVTTGLSLIIFALGINDRVDSRAWKTLSRICIALLFLLAGLTITPALFTDRWLAFAYGAGITIILRWLSVVVWMSLNSKNTRSLPSSAPWLFAFASPRGPVTLALAISLPLHFTGWYTVQALVYGGVIASLLISASLPSNLDSLDQP